MQREKGFTIIELIVVIAIIAVLAGIVMVNVTQYIAKSKDAAVKSSMAQMITSATAFYSQNGTYTGFCNAGTDCAMIFSYVTSRAKTTYIGSMQIQSDSTSWCLSEYLNVGSGTWCVDFEGFKGPGACMRGTGAPYSTDPYKCNPD